VGGHGDLLRPVRGAADHPAAPASLCIAKLILPETEESPTQGTVRAARDEESANVIDAIARGALNGGTIAVTVGALLIAFLAVRADGRRHDVRARRLRQLRLDRDPDRRDRPAGAGPPQRRRAARIEGAARGHARQPRNAAIAGVVAG
jgi:Na+ dependent nucleoside transporter